MKTMNEVNAFLESDIPRGEISTRKGSNNTNLSYLKTWKVNDLLNACFGNMGWSSSTSTPVLIGQTEDRSGKLQYVYLAKTEIKALVAGESSGTFLQVTHDGVGTCIGYDHEMAIKGAESDSLKRAAVKFGKRLGLALYDKSEEFIDDSESKKPAAASPRPSTTGAKPSVLPKPQVEQAPQAAAKGTSGGSNKERDTLNSLIRSTAAVAFSKKVLVEGEPWTMDRMKAMIASYGVTYTEDLQEPQAREVLGFLNQLVN